VHAPLERTVERTLIHTIFSKFFEQQQNGPKSKPQQSTLAFNHPKASKSADPQKAEVDGAQSSGKSQDKPPKGNVLNGDQTIDSDREMDKSMTNGHQKDLEVKGSAKETDDGGYQIIVDKPSTDGAPAEMPERAATKVRQKSSPKRSKSEIKDEEDEDEEPVKKRPRRREPQDKSKHPAKVLNPENPTEAAKSNPTIPKAMKVDSKSTVSITKKGTSGKASKAAVSSGPQHSEKADSNKGKPSEVAKGVRTADKSSVENDTSDAEKEEADSDEEDEEKPEVAAKAREKVQSTLKSVGKDPYPDWPPGEPVPYAALCTTFSLIEMTTKRLVISAHCSLFLRQVLRLTPQDLLSTVQLMINKLAADYAGIELGIGESLIMKAIGESTGRSLQIIKADQNEIGDLGLVAAKSRSNQPTMFKPKALTVRGVLEGLMNIAVIQGDGSQGRKVAGIKKLLSAADAAIAGKGSKGIDITKDKGGASEAKFIIRFLEGKLRLGLAEKTVLVALAHAIVIHEIEKKGNKLPSSEELANGEFILKGVFR